MGEIVPGETVIDAAVQYAQNIPVNVIGRMLGFPAEDEDLFREFVHTTLERINDEPEARAAAFERLDNYILGQVQDHIDNPRDDLTGYLLEVEIEGNKLAPEHVSGSILLLLVAGIDTTWSAIGSSIWHLAQHPDDRQRLVDDPEVMTFALEEFLRAYAPVTMARMVAKDVDFHGCPMKKDDWVLLPFPAANRDPHMFEDPDTFIIDREQNRHSAFGLGIHRCLGSNLARLELKVAIEEFVARFPQLRARRRRPVERRPGPRPPSDADPHPRNRLRTRKWSRCRARARHLLHFGLDEEHAEGGGGTGRRRHQRRVGDRSSRALVPEFERDAGERGQRSAERDAEHRRGVPRQVGVDHHAQHEAAGDVHDQQRPPVRCQLVDGLTAERPAAGSDDEEHRRHVGGRSRYAIHVAAYPPTIEIAT